MNVINFNSPEAALDFMDNYAAARKEEIDRHQLSKGSGLIKSYALETSSANSNDETVALDVEKLLSRTNWNFKSIGQNGFFRVDAFGELIGFAEVLSSRHLALHTFRERGPIESAISTAVRDSAALDFVWLAGNFLNLLWEVLIREQMPERFVSFKFEYLGRFGESTWQDPTEDEELTETEDDQEDAPEVIERRASTLAVSARVSKIARFLPHLQDVLSDFKAIKMLRFPAREILRGGYDFWDWGKVTYRSPSFRDGRSYLSSIVQLYQEATEIIEQTVWYQAERTQRLGGYDISLTGTPVSFVFPVPLESSTFQNFIDTTFERGHGPFRLWGDPIWLGENKVHVYGVDLHLWQRIYLELSPHRFIAILPQGTCGNSIHRLVSNIQRYISPDVETFIGDYRYEDLIRDVLLGTAKPQ